MIRLLATIALLILTMPIMVFGQQPWPPVGQGIPGFNPLIPSVPTAPQREDASTERSKTRETKATNAQAQIEQTAVPSRQPANANETSWHTEQSDPRSTPAGDGATPDKPNSDKTTKSLSSDAPVQPPAILSTALPTQYRVRQLPTIASSLAAPVTNPHTPQNFVAQPRLPMINGPATGQFSFGNQIPNAAIVPQRPRRSANIAPPPRSRALQLRSAGGGCVIQGSRTSLGNSFAPTTFVPF